MQERKYFVFNMHQIKPGQLNLKQTDKNNKPHYQL